ncbi:MULTISPECIES: hypothetical protein [unclassified Herbaspirillum]|uniref:hypothetical protein n=1 Tax=unclassified Herbaspirillum TaxID=2624150 RepID=UPI00116AE995|nr:MULTISPECIES: hypothetical protein [unclassified Herbaspirillum]MBB5392727.1 hypothetical protein [Herbaspirillum sp. SJZ102]TQJ99101.1 hypothetical protein FB599_4099 [Herbaspirillum sp. SJZ130]TQK04114.1 hypothetical protein FB598_4041 [Herbaspirillum sp. SJZ106]
MAAQSLLLTGVRLQDGGHGFFLVNMPVNFDLQESGSGFSPMMPERQARRSGIVIWRARIVLPTRKHGPAACCLL